MREVTIRGESLWVHDNEDLSNHIVREQDFFEAPILDYLRDHYNKQRIIVDIGANIGNHTVYFSRYLKHSYIYAFEPIPKNFEVLEKNTENMDDVIISALALSDVPETLQMSIHSSNWGVAQVDPLGPIEVNASTLDLLELGDISLIKIDVENFEPEVIKGAQETINKYRPLILIEDNFNTYEHLFPGYRIEQGWEISKTYLYVPRES